MIIAVVGSGGKTTLIKKLAARYRREGKTVLVTTTTHMFIEDDTLLTDDAEPVVPEHTDEIIVVCGLNAIGQKAEEVYHRLELVKKCLGIADDTIITPEHIRTLVTEGYLRPLREAHPDKQITLSPRHDGSPEQRAIAAMLQAE